MSRNRLLVGGIVIVAVLVIAYFAFVYPPVSKEDTSGAIGVANKYRNEQIADSDVMLKNQEEAAAAAFALMSPEEKAAMFDRTTSELQKSVYATAPAEMTSKLIARTDNAVFSRYWAGLANADKIAVFEAASKPNQDAILKSANITTAAYKQMSVDERVGKVFSRASNVNIANMVKDFALQGNRSFFEKADRQCVKDFGTLLSREDKINLMGYAPRPVIASMEHASFAADFFGKAAPEQQFAMLEVSEITTAVIGRADNAVFSRYWAGLANADKIAIFEAASKPNQDAILKSANITAAAYKQMSADERVSKVFSRGSNVTIANMVKDFALQGNRSFFAKADPQCKTDFVTLLDRGERFNLMGYAPAPVKAEMESRSFAASFFGQAAPEQQFAMLERSPEITTAVIGRADNAVFSRYWAGLANADKIAVFEAASKPNQDAILKSANITAAAYKQMSADERVSKVFSRGSNVTIANMVKDFALQGNRSFFAKADPQCKTDFVTLLDRGERFNLMGYAPEQMKVDMERAHSEMSKTSREQL